MAERKARTPKVLSPIQEELTKRVGTLRAAIRSEEWDFAEYLVEKIRTQVSDQNAAQEVAQS